ncbi:hypothetical protein RhiirA4_545216 [Rhizophagus irregularis]|uniref:Uncharacterized protein n=1 Tax=Rhizophagus irregularis TaxID=588596 RepID=A0A2I1GS10_9GLOM|nr:hypothetical protein RhiirA4_545216 [Rhizophagus irregularis]
MSEENEIIRCGDVIHVDNPPTNITDDDNANVINIRTRNRSREILLDHVEELCTWKGFIINWINYFKDQVHTETNMVYFREYPTVHPHFLFEVFFLPSSFMKDCSRNLI